eukprot:3273702-Pyramimonas_sp.AAC.1
MLSTGWRDAVTPVTLDTSPDRSLLHVFVPVVGLTSARTSRWIMSGCGLVCFEVPAQVVFLFCS